MVAQSGGKAAIFLLIIMMLGFGSYNTINIKFQDQTCAPTLDTSPKAKPDGCRVGQKLWAKPWLQNILMFIGEGTVGILYLATRDRSPVAQTSTDGLLSDAQQKTPFYVFGIPAFCDVFGTGLASVGMLWLDSATWQMLRSSIIIFSAITSVMFLKRRLQPFHWVAVMVVFLGLVLVGLASSLDTGTNTDGPQVTVTETLMGIGLVIVAQICSAFQMVFEEKLLTTGAPTSAKKVVGCEGAWGCIYMVVILALMTNMPGSDNGHYEDLSDGIHMLTNEPSLLFFVVTYMASIAIYNLTGIIVGKTLSAVVRCLIDSCRTIVVWIVNLIMYYFISKKYGTPWKDHSWLMAVGFACLVIGTLLYNEVLPAPAVLRREDPDQDEEFSTSMVSGSFHDILNKVDLTDESEGRNPQVREFRTGNVGAVASTA